MCASRFSAVSPASPADPGRAGSRDDEPLCSRCVDAIDQLQPPGDVGWAVARALLSQTDWVHRRTDAVRLLDGEAGDHWSWLELTPPTDRGLRYPFGHVNAPLLAVPLTIITKEPAAGLEVVDAGRQRLPTLDPVESAIAGWSTLLAVARIAGAVVDPAGLTAAFGRMTRAHRCCATETATQLLTDGLWAGRPVLDPKRWTELAPTAGLLPDLASGSLLFVLLPESAAGARCLVGIHSRFELADRRRGTATQYVGVAPTPIAVDIDGCTDASCYDLDVQAPAGLLITSVTLPTPADPTGQPTAERTRKPIRRGLPVPSPAARTSGRYEVGAAPATASVLLTPNRHGIMPLVAVLATVTAACIVAPLIVPGLLDALATVSGGSAALLWVGSAAVLALIIRPGENAITSRVLIGARIGLIACALIVGIATESLLGRLPEPWLRVLWLCLGVLSVTLAVAAVTGWHAVRRGCPRTRRRAAPIMRVRTIHGPRHPPVTTVDSADLRRIRASALRRLAEIRPPDDDAGERVEVFDVVEVSSPDGSSRLQTVSPAAPATRAHPDSAAGPRAP
jgi:hypothetical protein